MACQWALMFYGIVNECRSEACIYTVSFKEILNLKLKFFNFYFGKHLLWKLQEVQSM